jgi:hypothetical protein
MSIQKTRRRAGVARRQARGIEALHIEVKALHEKCKTASYIKLDMQAKNEKSLAQKEEEFMRFHLQNDGQQTQGIAHSDLRQDAHASPQAVFRTRY